MWASKQLSPNTQDFKQKCDHVTCLRCLETGVFTEQRGSHPFQAPGPWPSNRDAGGRQCWPDPALGTAFSQGHTDTPAAAPVVGGFVPPLGPTSFTSLEMLTPWAFADMLPARDLHLRSRALGIQAWLFSYSQC